MKDFFENPHIRRNKDKKKWTISKDKVPIDLKRTLSEKRITPAYHTDERSLITLAEIKNLKPNNFTFYLNSLTDGFMVLDIEPSCPEDLREKLLTLPTLYTELSESKKGYHLILDLPKNFYDFPNAYRKTQLKHEKGYYEILLNHYITFRPSEQIENKQTNLSLEDFYEEIAKKQKYKEVKKINIKKETDFTEFEKYLIERLNSISYFKTVEDFSGDYSRYEYGYVSNVFHTLNRVLYIVKEKDDYEELTDEQKANIIYTVATNNLEFREKHNSTRENLPWLLYIAKNIIEKSKEV